MINATKKCTVLDLWALPLGQWPCVNSSPMNQSQEPSWVTLRTSGSMPFPVWNVYHAHELLPSWWGAGQVPSPLQASDRHLSLISPHSSCSLLWTLNILSLIPIPLSAYFKYEKGNYKSRPVTSPRLYTWYFPPIPYSIICLRPKAYWLPSTLVCHLSPFRLFSQCFAFSPSL